MNSIPGMCMIFMLEKRRSDSLHTRKVYIEPGIKNWKSLL